MDLTGAEPRERGYRAGRRRDLQLAGALFTGGLALFWIGVYEADSAEPQFPLLITLAVTCGALLLRRTAPVPAVLIGTVAFMIDLALGPSLGTILAFAELLYDACLHGRPWVARRVLVAMSALTVGVACVTLAVSELPNGLYLAINVGLILVLPPVTALEVRRYRDRAAAEKLRAYQLERLAELDRQQAVAAERARMARELHDVIANHLSAIAIHATGAAAVGGQLDPRVRNALAVIRENSVQGLAEMRQMIELLREPGAEEPVRARLDDIGRLIAYAREAGLRVTVHATGDPDRPLPVAVDLAAYRIVQESLTNAVKHAAGGAVDLTIEHRLDGITVTVESTPAPSTPAASTSAAVPGSGVGLIGMRERVNLLGGAFEAGPNARGFRVHAELPA
jgi:signal transduction histidine kinase